MPSSDPLDLLIGAAAAIRQAVESCDDGALPGNRPDQYQFDLVADAAALDFLGREGVRVVSEESGTTGPADAEVTVVVDPVDGSTNASRGLPFYASSLCALDASGPLAAVVDNLGRAELFTARRGGGAHLDGTPIAPTECRSLEEATIALAGRPPAELRWGRMRSLGAVALELCGVAAGRFDAFVNFDTDYHGPWDYLGGWLICVEAGVSIIDAEGRDPWDPRWETRRSPAAAATPELLDQVLAARALLST